MINLIRAELRKLFSTKLWLWLLLGACVLSGGSTALLIGFADQAAASPQRESPRSSRMRSPSWLWPAAPTR